MFLSSSLPRSLSLGSIQIKEITLSFEYIKKIENDDIKYYRDSKERDVPVNLLHKTS